MVRNSFLAPLIIPPVPQHGGLGLYQITGLLTPPPTPPPPPAPFPYPNVGTGFLDEAIYTAPGSPQLEGLEFSEAVSATLPTSPQLGGLGIYEPEPSLGDTGNVDTSISCSSQTGVDEATTGSEVNENTPLEAQASFTPVTAPEPTDEESNDEEQDENQGDLVDHSPFIYSSTLHSSPLPAFVPEISFESVVVSAPFSTFAGQVSLFRKKTMQPLPEGRRIKRKRSESPHSRKDDSPRSSVNVPLKRHRGQKYFDVHNGRVYHR